MSRDGIPDILSGVDVYSFMILRSFWIVTIKEASLFKQPINCTGNWNVIKREPVSPLERSPLGNKDRLRKGKTKS